MNHPRGPRRVLAILVTLVLAGPALVSVVAPVAPAGAQATGASGLRLASQTAWVGPGEEYTLRLLVNTTQPTTDVEVVVAVYRRVAHRSEFTQTLESRPRGVPLTVTPPSPLAELGTDAGGAVVVRLPVQDPAQPADRSRLRLNEQGVYPVRAELRGVGGGPPLATLLTHLIYTSAPGEGGFPLDVGLVLPVHAAPALQADGSRRLPEDASQRLGALARSLASPSGMAFTLRPTPETLAALEASTRAGDRETLAALARAAQGRQTAAATYVPVSLPALGDAGLNSEAVAQLDRGNEVVERILGTRPDVRTWVADDPIDVATVQRLRGQQVDRLVVPGADLEPVDLDVTLAQPFEVAAPDVRSPAVLAGDTGLATYFSPSDDPVLAAHHLLADLAVIYRDQPSRRRAVVAAPPRTWLAPAAFVETLLAGLESSPVLRATTLDGIFDEVPPATTRGQVALVRRLVPLVASRPLPAAEIRATRATLRSFASMLKPDNPLDDDLEARLLTAQSVDLRPNQRAAYLGGLRAAVATQTALVEVPDKRSVTLTARRGEIPVTVLSRADYPVLLHLEVVSEKLDFPDGDSRTVEVVRRNTTELFSVQARTSGTFPLRLRLTTPDGAMVLGTSRFTIRSTAASGVGVILSAGAGIFLLVWWARHLARGRRNRRLIPA
ncbi:MAG: DUF6049 family protein [Acidimicrobiales bacterium]